MVRSFRRRALIVALTFGGLVVSGLALSGLALSQQPRTTVPVTTQTVPITTASTQTQSTQAAPTQTLSTQPERVMTVHENGKALRCRIVTSWRLENGSTAYQVQSLETGEMLTIVEDGPSTTLDGRKGRMRAQSTKIFHWARNSTPPAGAPLPPQIVSSAPVTNGNLVLVSVTNAPPVVISEGPAVVTQVDGPCQPGCIASGPQTPNRVAPVPVPARLASQSGPFSTAMSNKTVVADCRPCPPSSSNGDWRGQWGGQLAGKNVPPGQSTIERSQLAAADTNRPGSTFSSLPPASKPETKPEPPSDVLLNPSRAGVADERRAIQRRQNLPGGDARAPLGAQSVIAASNGLGPMYVPVPIVTVPQPNRPPVPPAPVPPPAPQFAYQNAFSPAQQQMPQMANPAIVPGLPMGYQPAMLPAMPPGPNNMGPGYPFGYPPMPHQYAGGQLPIAQMNYPQTYRGPMPPNPVDDGAQAGYPAPMPYGPTPYASTP